ncbi:putative signal transduction protein with CBS domains [Anaeromyxobacter dehalogenans 2CP-1]|uniref:Signal transduction protein with CBS domains n=1 Tax=Anaeromyxobacter dehalogenans (strain ATCC BAA-258 / DSM 21875 / 2CP-1) TaxID=455488 RepID=B8JGQ2_ANAD2|nr:CBS domain-containing protein [Anaeromyxobacter dehalogenans]ACL66539.1 putative signal transduction protein with CBS domains [Anaeromyxobacter dehalogenans 2CP-1]
MASIHKHVTREMVSLEATAPIREAARLMSERKIGSVAVRDGGRIVGLVTERDLVATVLARGADANHPMREAMRQGLPRVSSSATEVEVAGLMRDHTTRHLLVEEGGQVVGVVSMRDIIQLMLDEKQFLIEQLQTYIDGR